MTAAKNKIEKTGIIGFIKQYEYEIILFVFLLFRFVFKNILGLTKYFTGQPVFGLSNEFCIVLGTAVVLAVCVCLACFFGQLIRKNGKDFEKPIFILIALFFACPATLPFLFDTNSSGGTQLLYPFAFFVLAVYLTGKPVAKWLVPVICALYFIPAAYTSENFFTSLRKEAILYVPLVLLFLFLDMAKKYIEQESSQKKNKEASAEKIVSVWDNSNLFTLSLLVSTGSYIYTLIKGISGFDESFYGKAQKIDGYLMVCLLITAPLLVTAAAVFYSSVKNNFPGKIYNYFWIAQILLFLLFWNNYYGLWVPFLMISLSMVVFFGVWQKNAAMLSAVRTVEEFFSKRRLLFLFFLIVMSSLANTSSYSYSNYLSELFRSVFNTIPF